MSQLNSANWNLALPSIASLEGSVLPIVVNNTVFGIMLGQVHYVDYPEALTPLPLTSSPEVRKNDGGLNATHCSEA